jgi:hypothetical protein
LLLTFSSCPFTNAVFAISLHLTLSRLATPLFFTCHFAYQFFFPFLSSTPTMLTTISLQQFPCNGFEISK